MNTNQRSDGSKEVKLAQHLTELVGQKTETRQDPWCVLPYLRLSPEPNVVCFRSQQFVLIDTSEDPPVSRRAVLRDLDEDGGPISPVNMASNSVTIEDIVAARERIKNYVHVTPIMTSSTMDELTGREIFFKCENFQKTGAFKARGAINTVLSIKEGRITPGAKGVVTHSSGNHGMALAWAAQIGQLACDVVIANTTSDIKKSAIQRNGAVLTQCEPNAVSRIETCKRISDEKGYEIISTCDHPCVIAGQGTMALEILDEIPDLDAIFVPTSGGGMAAGIAIAAKAINPNIKIFSVEPEGKNLEPCLRSGERLWPNPPQFLDTIADAMPMQQAGKHTFPILCELVEKTVFTVANDDIVKALRFAFQRMKIVIEGAAALGIAAVMSDKMKSLDPSIRKVAVILSGGNIDIDHLPWAH
ncbi:hypothetical protein ScPMuIL_006250 [Solemya velum]